MFARLRSSVEAKSQREHKVKAMRNDSRPDRLRRYRASQHPTKARVGMAIIALPN